MKSRAAHEFWGIKKEKRKCTKELTGWEGKLDLQRTKGPQKYGILNVINLRLDQLTSKIGILINGKGAHSARERERDDRIQRGDILLERRWGDFHFIKNVFTSCFQIFVHIH